MKKGLVALFVLTMLVSAWCSPLVSARPIVGALSDWQTASNSLPKAIQNAGSATYNGYVYEVGGYDGSSVLSSVYYAQLAADGSVGSWQTTASLPHVVSHLSVVQSNGYLYAIGGFDGNTDLDSVYYAKFNANGSLGAWQTTTALPNVSYDGSAAAYHGYLYELGGDDGAGSQDSVYYAKFNANGSLGAWQTTTMPHALEGAGTAISNDGYIYEVGGFDGTSVQDTIYYAKLNADGSLSTWQPTQPMRGPSAYGSVLIINGYLYDIAGSSGSGLNNPGYSAQLNTDGSIYYHSTLSRFLPDAVESASAVAYNGYLYNIGGFDANSTPVSSVAYTQPYFYTNTTSMVNAVTADPVTVTTPDGTVGTCASSVTEASLSTQDSAYSYPLGLVNLCLLTALPDTPMTLTFVTDLQPSQVVARDFNTQTQTYTTIPGAVITATTYNGQPALQLTYNLADNGPLDTNSDIGSLADPVGLGVLRPVTNSTKVGTSLPSAPNTGAGTPSDGYRAVILLTSASAISLVSGAWLQKRGGKDSRKQPN